MLMDMVYYVSAAVLCNKPYLNVIFLNKFCSTTLLFCI